MGRAHGVRSGAKRRNGAPYGAEPGPARPGAFGGGTRPKKSKMLYISMEKRLIFFTFPIFCSVADYSEQEHMVNVPCYI